MSKPTKRVQPMTAWAVIKVPGGFQAFRVEISEDNSISRTPMCDPCAESVAFTYLRARMDEAWIQRLIDTARATGR